MTSVAGLCMWKDDSNLMDPSLPFPCSFLFLFQYFLHFREAVIRSYATWQMRGKSGHQRAGFPVKAGGGLFQDKFTASATENKPPHLWGKGEKVG